MLGLILSVSGSVGGYLHGQPIGSQLSATVRGKCERRGKRGVRSWLLSQLCS